MPKTLITIVILLLISSCSDQNKDAAAESGNATGTSGHQMGDSTARIAVKTPEVPFKLGRGMEKFQDKCSSCHGKWGGGSKQGPPLMHAFYRPAHHGDSAFYRAAQNGVRAHHWKFGDMPPVAGITPDDIAQILPFIRWLQKENGIY